MWFGHYIVKESRGRSMRLQQVYRDIRDAGQPDKKEVINVQLTSSVRVSEWLFEDCSGE